MRREVESWTRFPALAGLAVAILVGVASVFGLADPDTYARETVSWQAQGIGQDVVDLIVGVPWLVGSALATYRGSRRGALVLAGGLAYTAYSFAIYAFDVHFNQLFLVYCATLGISLYGLGSLAVLFVGEAIGDDFGPEVPRRRASVMMIATALVFGVTWLAEDVPAILRGEPPASLAEVALPTNAVHVLDLSLVLPSLLIGGMLVWQRRPLGYVIAAVVMGFSVLMNLAIAGITLVMRGAGLPGTRPMVGSFVAIAALSALLLWSLLRSMTPRPPARA